MRTALFLIFSALRRYFHYLTGTAIIALSGFIAASLFSYNPEDPSFNRAVDNSVTNIGGEAGAYIADPLLQFFGLATIILVLVPLIYGLRILFKHRLSLVLVRLTMMVLCLMSLSIVLAFIEPSGESYFASGGITGILIIQKLALIPSVILLPIAAVIAAFSFFMALEFSLSEWGSFFQHIYDGTLFIQERLQSFHRMLAKCYYTILPKKTEDDIYAGLMPEPKARPEPKIEKTKTERTIALRKRISLQPTSEKSARTRPLSHYELPSLTLLTSTPERQRKNSLSEAMLAQNATLLEGVLDDFGVQGKIVKIRPGPVVTLYELEPAAGIKSSRVIGLSDDIARSMSAISARIAVIPGRNAIGIELPNANREIVHLRELLESPEYLDENYKLPVVLGKNISGDSVIMDLAKMPHLLVAGTTGSGKSVAINTMILSFIYRLTPEQCKFIMIDPKMLELSLYDGIPHLLAPVVTEPAKAVIALKWTVKEMENRYRLMSNLGVRNIAGYNKRIEEALNGGEVLERTVQTGFEPETGKPIIEKVPLDMTPLPFIVVIVDEMADLMLVAGKEIETSIQRLAQMARAAGIHIIMATQRPSVDVITGVIKANFPTRISFQVTSRIDSRTILGEQGAEQLLGMGDMLYMAGANRITRVHGPFVDDMEVERIVSFLKTQAPPSYNYDITHDDTEDNCSARGGDADENELYRQAVALVCRDGKPSTNYVQRCLKIGYNRAATLIERMEKEGIISHQNHAGKREIIGKNGG